MAAKTHRPSRRASPIRFTRLFVTTTPSATRPRPMCASVWASWASTRPSSTPPRGRCRRTASTASCSPPSTICRCAATCRTCVPAASSASTTRPSRRPTGTPCAPRRLNTPRPARPTTTGASRTASIPSRLPPCLTQRRAPVQTRRIQTPPNTTTSRRSSR